MKSDSRFIDLSPVFWANVRTISQSLGYTNRTTKGIRVHTQEEIEEAYFKLGLSSEHLFPAKNSTHTEMGFKLLDYFAFRAEVLENHAEPNLMDYPEALKEFNALKERINPTIPFTLNKQKGEKAGPALLTGMVNMILEESVGLDFDSDPRQLTTITRDGFPLRTLARRVDGAYPSIINPVAIWEIKEYYFTTTFGSRVADGVYETLLDGLELEELRNQEGIDVKHFLIVDSYKTWWEMGRSYLCRMVDLQHMGLVDEVLFGKEVLTQLPELVKSFKKSS